MSSRRWTLRRARVPSDQPTVAGDIGGEDGGKLALDVLL
jgi:hypothetical protein